jgi:ribosomal protein L16/L10AE
MNIRLKYPQKFKKQHKKRTGIRRTVLVSKALSSVVGVYSATSVLLPNRFIAYVRKLLKKFLKKRKITCWFRLEPNRLITSKAKNSRMGKGVGTGNRVGFYVRPTTPILIMANISNKRTSFIISLLQPRFPTGLYFKKL